MIGLLALELDLGMAARSSRDRRGCEPREGRVRLLGAASTVAAAGQASGGGFGDFLGGMPDESLQHGCGAVRVAGDPYALLG